MFRVAERLVDWKSSSPSQDAHVVCERCRAYVVAGSTVDSTHHWSAGVHNTWVECSRLRNGRRRWTLLHTHAVHQHRKSHSVTQTHATETTFISQELSELTKIRQMRLTILNDHQQLHVTGCLQIQPNKFPDFQDTFDKVPAGFLHWSSLLSITTWDTNTGTFSYVRHYE